MTSKKFEILRDDIMLTLQHNIDMGQDNWHARGYLAAIMSTCARARTYSDEINSVLSQDTRYARYYAQRVANHVRIMRREPN